MILRSSPTYRRKMVVAGNGLFYPIVGFASCVAFIYMSFGGLGTNLQEKTKLGFVERNGTQFMLDGKAFYINGWNSYWLMDHSVDEYTKPRVREILQAGAKMGLTVCRTWAFNDGDYNALQISPGRFNEQVFKVLIIHVILSFCRIVNTSFWPLCFVFRWVQNFLFVLVWVLQFVGLREWWSCFAIICQWRFATEVIKLWFHLRR